MSYTVYLYRAPTPSEAEAGGYDLDYEPDKETVNHCRDLPDLCAEISPDWTGCIDVGASSYPIQKGSWITVTYGDGSQASIHRPNMTPASIKRLINYLADWV